MSKAPRAHASTDADEIAAHAEDFFAKLPAMGYAPTTQHGKRWLVRRFVSWARRAGLAAGDIDEACIGRFLARGRCKPCKMERTTLRQFLDHLRAIEVASPGWAPESSSFPETLLRGYREHLHRDRGLCARSVEIYTPFARALLVAHGRLERVESLDAATIRAYLVARSRNRSSTFVKLLAAALRSFLRFLFFNGVTQTDISRAVPPVRRWRLKDVPPYLTHDEVERVLAMTDRSTTRGCRAHAMLLLLVRLGLRAGEVATLELDDILWDIGEIVVRGKGRRRDRLPLLDDVGEALAVYLREARSPSSSRRVFLRRCAPYIGLSGPTAVCLVARQAVRRAGLMPTGRVGAHIFRHSLATRMLHCGASLEEIAQVLRHRSLGTTQIYAKVEREALGGIAMPWPGFGVRP